MTAEQDNAVREVLFNVPPKDLNSDGLLAWNNTLFEQYKLYVEMSDKISERRNNANSFFLTANTLLITIFGGLVTFLSDPQGTASSLEPYILLQTPMFGIVSASAATAGIILCITWFNLITRYKNLNQQKFFIIQQLESKLPSKPYVAEELVPTTSLRPLTTTERFIPMVFILLYVFLILCLIWLYAANGVTLPSPMPTITSTP